MIHFYFFQKDNKLLVSDHSRDKIKVKYGPNFEIVNSVKDKESLNIVKTRIARSYPKAIFIEDFYVKKVFSAKTRAKLRQRKLGKPRADWVKQKISSKMKGKSNFEGKRHNEDSKRKTARALQNNTNVKGKVWVYNPYSDTESRVDNILEAPSGFRKGRDPEKVLGLNPSYT